MFSNARLVWRRSTASVSPLSRWSRCSPTQTIGTSLAQRGHELLVHQLICFTEILAAFRVANQHMSSACGYQHRRGDLASEGAFVRKIHVLRTDMERGPFCGIQRGWKIDRRRKDRNFLICRQRALQKCGYEGAGFGRSLIFQLAASECAWFLSCGQG
jgi:hypothetical protein